MTVRSILEDYLTESGPAFELYETHFKKQSDFLGRVKRAAERRIHPVILAELREQNAPLAPEAERSIAALQSGAPAVLTGQQLGFLGGPLLTLYKIAGAIKFAKIIEEKTGIKAVPIFWMQSEDHDFAEIAEAKFLGEGEALQSAALESPEGVVGDSVGFLKVSEDISGLASKFGMTAPEFEAAAQAFAPGKTLVDAYGRLIKGLFAQHGLLVFSPLSPPVKKYSKDFLTSSFFRANGIERVLSDRAAWLKSNDYPVQVPLKEKSPLFFVSKGGGRRRLVESREGQWSCAEFALDKETLYQLIDERPESFTASALIRPIYQDFLFPTAAYIAGSSEINYWAQATPLYTFFGVPQPLVVPRPRATIFEEKYLRIAEKAGASLLNLNPTPVEFLRERLSGSKFSPDAIFGPVSQEIAGILDSRRNLLLEIDPMLEKGLAQTHESIEGSLNKLKGRYERSLGIREEAVLRQYERLQRVALPEGKAQEQVLSFMYFVGKYGGKFISEFLEQTTFESFGQHRVLIVNHDGALKVHHEA